MSWVLRRSTWEKYKGRKREFDAQWDTAGTNFENCRNAKRFFCAHRFPVKYEVWNFNARRMSFSYSFAENCTFHFCEGKFHFLALFLVVSVVFCQKKGLLVKLDPFKINIICYRAGRKFPLQFFSLCFLSLHIYIRCTTLHAVTVKTCFHFLSPRGNFTGMIAQKERMQTTYGYKEKIGLCVTPRLAKKVRNMINAIACAT